MPGNYRKNRINETVAHEIANIIRQVKDPRVQSAFITITSAQVTGDLKFAKIFYSFMQGDEKEIKKGLISATGFIRRELASRLNLRITPELKFIFDDSPKHGSDISAILKTLDIKPDDEEQQDEQSEF
ncbi:MAG: 30S ribosome-binding factor RbfA [Clostridia bacterium]|nr:30S ribosome-binding factor RbfA [Clostridia bacterium]